jgi:hypothetical protein
MTIFPHADHQKRLGDSTSCHICHHISIPHDHATPCSRCHRNLNSPTQIFEHSRHSEFVVESEKIHGWQPKNRTCAVCHVVGKPKTATSVKDCFACHEKDMFQPGTADSTVNLLSAPAFSIAMHKKCAECHAREAEKQNRPELGYCHTCHQSLRPRQFHEAQFAVGADLK